MERRIKAQPVLTDAEIETTAGLANVIWHECFAELLSPAQLDYMVDNMQSAPAITRQIREEGFAYFLLHMPGDDGAYDPGGYVGVRAGGNGRLMLSKLYILARHRGMGYGRQALSFVEEEGGKRGCSAIWLTVNRRNERAIAVYRKTGFVQTDTQVKDIGGGFVMDDFIFEKPL